MRLLIPALLLVVSSCATKKERAVRHLNKALELDSSVLQHVVTPIIIDTTIIYSNNIYIDTTIVVPETLSGVKITAKRFTELMDSVNNLNETVSLLENEFISLKLKKTKEGLLDLEAIIKARGIPFRDTIPVYDSIPVYFKKKVPTVAPVTKIVYKKGYFYQVGVTLHYLLGIALVIGVVYYVFYKRNSRN